MSIVLARHWLHLTIPQAAAINTVYGVSMTTRRQMLKIKVNSRI